MLYLSLFTFSKSTGEFPKPQLGVNTNFHAQHQQSQLLPAMSSVPNHGNIGGASNAHNSTAQQQQQAAFRAATPQISSSSVVSLAACQVTPGSEFILCKILFHDTVHKTYKLADEDVESNKSKFRFCIVQPSLLSCSAMSHSVSFPVNNILQYLIYQNRK